MIFQFGNIAYSETMNVNSLQASLFIRRSLEGKSNNTKDQLLSKIEDRIRDIGSYVKQRHGDAAYTNLLNHIHSTGETNS